MLYYLHDVFLAYIPITIKALETALDHIACFSDLRITAFRTNYSYFNFSNHKIYLFLSLLRIIHSICDLRILSSLFFNST